MHRSIPFTVRKAQRNSTLVFVAYALVNGFTTPGIDNAAHLGGLAGGFLAGLLLARPLDPEQRKSGGVRRMASVTIMGLTGVLVLVPFLSGSADATAYLVRGILDGQKHDLDGAIADATRAIEIDPKLVEAYVLRGAAKEDKGDLEAAISDFNLALEVDPRSWAAYAMRGAAKGKRRDFEGAIADLSHAIEINPGDALAHNELAWLLATAEQPAFRDGRRALKSALRACELSQWKDPSIIDTLAAAYARTGDFATAVEWQRKATADPKQKGNDGALQRLRLYQAGKAWPPD